MSTTSTKDNPRVIGRYILSCDLLQRLSDPHRESYQIEDHLEFCEFFSKQLILLYSNADNDYYSELIRRKMVLI